MRYFGIQSLFVITWIIWEIGLAWRAQLFLFIITFLPYFEENKVPKLQLHATYLCIARFPYKFEGKKNTYISENRMQPHNSNLYTIGTHTFFFLFSYFSFLESYSVKRFCVGVSL